MNDLTSHLLLLSVPGLPLLLALVAPWFRPKPPVGLALLPAVILVALPLPVTAELPWLLLGTRLGLDAASRWLLAGQILVWAAAARSLQPDRDSVATRRQTTFFLLTQGSSLGVVLAMDPVGFLAFSTVAGYGFYGLLAGAGGNAARGGRQGYLVAIILADLALLEGILSLASDAGIPDFVVLQSILVQSASRGLYLAVVLAGLALRAGAWPLHFWLRRLFSSGQPAVIILLPVVPVTLAMLGAVRWLPPGSIHSPVPGWLLLGSGLAAMLHALLPGPAGAPAKPAPFRLTLFATGLFTAFLGRTLPEPAIQNGQQTWIYVVIGLFGPAMAGFLLVSRRRQQGDQAAAIAARQPDNERATWLERLASWLLSRCRQTGYETLPRWRSYLTARPDRIRRILSAWERLLDKGEHAVQYWPLAMTLLLLLILLLAGSNLSS